MRMEVNYRHRANGRIRKGVWLGEVEAPDEAATTEKAAAEFKVPANRARDAANTRRPATQRYACGCILLTI